MFQLNLSRTVPSSCRCGSERDESDRSKFDKRSKLARHQSTYLGAADEANAPEHDLGRGNGVVGDPIRSTGAIKEIVDPERYASGAGHLQALERRVI